MEKIEITAKITKYKPEELDKATAQRIEQAKAIALKAYSPYSNFNVGAIVKLANGEIIAANNQENSAYPSGLCAERVAVFYANANFPEIAIESITIIGISAGKQTENPIAPCGACRQVLLESEERQNTEIKIILAGVKSTYIIDNVKSLLPLYFDKSCLC